MAAPLEDPQHVTFRWRRRCFRALRLHLPSTPGSLPSTSCSCARESEQTACTAFYFVSRPTRRRLGAVGGLCLVLAFALGRNDPPATPAAAPSAEGAASLAGETGAESKPADASAGSGEPARLEIDIQRAIDEVYARHVASGLPRFEEKVEIRDKVQEAIDERLIGIEEECDEAESGPPNHAELNRYRAYPVPVHWDYVAVAKFLVKTFKKRFGSKEPRYFIYAVRKSAREGSAPAAPELVMREGAISEAARAAVPGTSWELMASFRDRDEALRGLTRLRQGFASPKRAFADDRPPPWASTNCRPRRW